MAHKHQHADHIAVRTGAPAETAITLTEAKAHLRVDDTNSDTLITALIAAATDLLDYDDNGSGGVLGRAIVTQTWTVSFEGADHDGHIHLPVVTARDLVSMSYYDTSNVSQSLTITDFTLYANGDWAYVVPDSGVAWPTTYDRPDAITIVYRAGFGDADDVPQGIKQAMLLLIGHWFENRETVTMGGAPSDLPWAVEVLIGRHRLGWVR